MEEGDVEFFKIFKYTLKKLDIKMNEWLENFSIDPLSVGWLIWLHLPVCAVHSSKYSNRLSSFWLSNKE